MLNLINQRFGKLIVEKFLGKDKSLGYIWQCKCDCGKDKVASTSNLQAGRNKSCGCIRGIQNTKKDRKLSLLKILYFQLITRRKKKIKKDCSLPFKEFIDIIQKPCSYCGREWTHKYEDVSRNCRNRDIYKIKKISNEVIFYNGVDRLDSKIGYVSGNCVPCCKFCNSAKGELSIEEFKDLITKIYRKFNE